MDYFEAVQQGRKRVADALDVLQKEVGPSYPMLFLQLGVTPWSPVGEEMLHKLIQGKNDTAALIICDSKGNAKAMSAWMPMIRAQSSSRSLEMEGVPAFPGEVKLPI